MHQSSAIGRSHSRCAAKDICGLAGLGWLRWYSLLAQANRCIHQENPDLKRAKTLFDLVQSETGDVYNVSKERVRSALREAGVNV